MKSSIGNLWIIGLMVTFILLFVSYILVTVDYNRSFKMKNEILSIVEKKRGMTNVTGTSVASAITTGNVTIDSGTLQTINVFLYGSGYDIKGKCPADDDAKWYGVKNLNYNSTVSFERANSNKEYYWCFAKYTIRSKNKVYYRVRIFFRMNFPILGDILKFNVDGTTNVIPNLATNIVAD